MFYDFSPNDVMEVVGERWVGQTHSWYSGHERKDCLLRRKERNEKMGRRKCRVSTYGVVTLPSKKSKRLL